MAYHTKIGCLHLLTSRQSKELVQVELKHDMLQIHRRNVLKYLAANTEIDQERRVLLQRSDDGLGILIMGGHDYGKPVQVVKPLDGYPAAACGQIYKDDIILSVNGHSVQDKTHDEAAALLKNAGKYVTLHLARIKPVEEDLVDKHEKTVELQRGDDGLGLHITGGHDEEKPVQILNVLEEHPADVCGKISKGDLILSVNGQSVEGKTHHEVAELLKNAGKHVTLRLTSKKLDEIQDQPANKKQINQPDWRVAEEIPLTTASITKYKIGKDEQRSNALEVINKDGQKSVVLYFDNTEESFQDWYNSIHNNVSLLNEQEVEAQNSSMIESEKKIYRMGYVHEQLSANTQFDNWQRKFLVLRKDHIQIFATVPVKVSEWMRPEKAYALTQISIEILPATQGERPECIKLIAGIGDSHVISFVHHDDIVAWTNNIQVATFLAVKQMQTARFLGSWKNQRVDFIVDYSHGLLIQSDNALWNKPFSKLKSTSDDGINKLTMTFTDSSQEVVELEDLNIVVCTLQAFLAARVADIDMGFIVQAGLISPAQ